ncbi:MAG TPA: M15 family metallopeptidase, partial [Kribbella sp.]|nr:M15 family metallopeptidase [Kribbella sp.]
MSNHKVRGGTAVLGALLLGVLPVSQVAHAESEPSADPSASSATASPAATSTTSSVTPTTPPESTPTETTPPETTPAETTSPETTTPAATAEEILSISLDQPATQWEDRLITFSGKLSNGAVDWYISLWQNTSKGWILRGATRTTAGGAYTIKYALPSPVRATFRTAVGSQLVGARAVSPQRVAEAKDRRLTMTQPASVYVTLTGVAVAGQLTPVEVGRGVLLEYRNSSGYWRPLTQGTTDANGRFRLRVPDNYPAHWTVRVRTLTTVAATEYTATAAFDVKAYLNPKVYAVTAATVSKTYRSGCPVGPASLRLLTLNYWGMDARVHRGQLVVRDAAVQKMINVWNAALIARFPIRRMERVDVFGGSDILSMEADNTSVFNCRQVTGNPYALSPHSYGFAIDINTVENHYL